jgi:hypothetical protein
MEENMVLEHLLLLRSGLCDLFFRFYRSGLIRVRTEIFTMRVRMRGVNVRKFGFILRVMFGVRVEMVISMVMVLLIFA